MIANQVEDERCELTQLARDYTLWHLVDEDGDELETGCSHTTSVVLREESPHVVLSLLLSSCFLFLRCDCLASTTGASTATTALFGGRLGLCSGIYCCLLFALLLNLIFLLLCWCLIDHVIQIEDVEELRLELFLLLWAPILNKSEGVGEGQEHR